MRTSTATVVGTAALVATASLVLVPATAQAKGPSGGSSSSSSSSSGWTLPVPTANPCVVRSSSSSAVVCDTNPGHYAVIEEGASLDAAYAALGYTKRSAVNWPWRYVKTGAKTVCFTVGMLEDGRFQVTGSRWNGSVEGTSFCR